jgi:hypothetical protein
LTRAANVAGLMRTAEIFLIEKVVIANKKKVA